VVVVAGFFLAGAAVVGVVGVLAGVAAGVAATTGCFKEAFAIGAGAGWVAALVTGDGFCWITAALVAAEEVAGTAVAAGCRVTALVTGAGVASGFTAVFAVATQGVALAAGAAGAAAAFLCPNRDPKLEIAEVAFVTALLAVAFCCPAVFATLASFDGVAAVPGGHGCVADAEAVAWLGTKADVTEETLAMPPEGVALAEAVAAPLEVVATPPGAMTAPDGVMFVEPTEEAEVTPTPLANPW
jgi:hypothetical protein